MATSRACRPRTQRTCSPNRAANTFGNITTRSRSPILSEVEGPPRTTIWSRSKSTSRTRSVQHSLTRIPVPYNASAISRIIAPSAIAPITRRTSSTLSTVRTRARRSARSPSIGPRWSAPNSPASTSRYRNTIAFIACVCVDRAHRRPAAR